MHLWVLTKDYNLENEANTQNYIFKSYRWEHCSVIFKTILSLTEERKKYQNKFLHHAVCYEICFAPKNGGYATKI